MNEHVTKYGIDETTRLLPMYKSPYVNPRDKFFLCLYVLHIIILLFALIIVFIEFNSIYLM